MGCRARIAVAINRTELLVTGSHWGGYLDENGPVLLAEYGTFEKARELAEQLYLHGGIEPLEDLHKAREKVDERQAREARRSIEKRHGSCIDENQLEFGIVDTIADQVSGLLAEWRRRDEPKVIHIESLMTERNVPSDIEAVYLWKEGAWYVAKPFQKRVSDVPFKSLISALNAADIHRFCPVCLDNEYWHVRHGEKELTCDGCYERERG